MTILGDLSGGSVLGPAFGPQGAASPQGAPAQPALPPDLRDATLEPDGSAWVSRGGEFYTVPKESLAQALQVPGLRFAAPQEVDSVREAERVAAAPGAQLKAGLEQFGVGLADAITALPRGGAALGSVIAEAAGSPGLADDFRDFAREAGGHALAKDTAFLGGGAAGDYKTRGDAEQSFVRAYQAREQAFPLTAGVARTAGLLVPAIATGLAAGAATAPGAAAGAAGGSSGALEGLATTLLSPSGVARVAAGGALQGLGGGLAAPFETMENTPISSEAILASGGMGALLGGLGGGALGAVTAHGPAALRRVFGRGGRAAEAADAEIRASLPDAIQQMAEGSAEQRELFSSIMERGQVAGRGVQEIADRIEAAAAKVGPNPELKAAALREAAAAEAQRLAGRTGEVVPSEWRSASLTPDEMVRNRDVLRQGAREEITTRLSDVLTESRGVMDHLKGFELKRPLVAKNLEALSPDQQTNAIKTSLANVREQREAFEQLFQDGADALRPTRASESLGFSFNQAEEAIRNAPEAADAYVAIDRLRRETNKWLAPLTSQTRSADAFQAFEGRKLLSFAEGAYERSRQLLADSATWGKQGELQQKVNQAWADDIAAEGRVTKLGSFVDRDISGRYGEAQFRVNPDKVDRYLANLGVKTLPDTDLHRMLETKASLMQEVAKAYDLPADQVARVATNTRELGAAIKHANELMTTSGGLESQITRLLQTRLAQIGGNAAGAALGGLAGGVPGALVGHTVGAALEEYAATKVPQIVGMLTSNKLGFGKLPQVYQKALNRQISTSIPAGSRALFEAVGAQGGRAAELEQYEKRTQVLAKLATTPAAAQAASGHLARYDSVAAGLAARSQLGAMERMRRLYAAWPGQTTQNARGKAQTTVSSSDLKLANAMWNATAKPLSTLDDFAEGKLDADQAAFTWVQYPELQRLFQAAALDTLRGIPEDTDVPHQALAQLDLFLGFNGALDESQSPEQLAVTASLMGLQQTEEAAAQPRPINTESFQTRTNRMMGV